MAKSGITRVVATLDAVSDNRRAIETASDLALRWHARLHGLFIEDEALLRAAELPFTRQVNLRAGQQPLDAPTIESEFRALARHARQLLGDAAARHHLDWSFQIIRDHDAVPRGDAGDFIVVQADARPFAGHVRLPSRHRPAPIEIRHPTLLLRRPRRPRQPVVVAWIAGAPSERVVRSLAVAAEFASFGGSALTVLAEAINPVSTGLGALAEQFGIKLRLAEARATPLECDVLALPPGSACGEALARTGDYDVLLLP
jgi:hypothetical protein